MVAESAADGGGIEEVAVEETTKEDQDKYAALIGRLRAAQRPAERSEDQPDGAKKPDFSLDDVALLCEADVKTLAEHIGMPTASAERLQQRLQSRLSELRQKEEFEQLEQLVKQLKKEHGKGALHGPLVSS